MCSIELARARCALLGRAPSLPTKSGPCGCVAYASLRRTCQHTTGRTLGYLGTSPGPPLAPRPGAAGVNQFRAVLLSYRSAVFRLGLPARRLSEAIRDVLLELREVVACCRVGHCAYSSRFTWRANNSRARSSFASPRRPTHTDRGVGRRSCRGQPGLRAEAAARYGRPRSQRQPAQERASHDAADDANHFSGGDRQRQFAQSVERFRSIAHCHVAQFSGDLQVRQGQEILRRGRDENAALRRDDRGDRGSTGMSTPRPPIGTV